MNRMRTLLDSGVPLIAVSFYDNDSTRLAMQAQAAGIDVAELRIDQFARTDVAHVLDQVRAFGAVPTLATVRAAHEGGGWVGSERDRLALFRAVAPLVDAVDIELSSREILPEVLAVARQHDAVTIVSFHDFERTPDLATLRGIVDEANGVGADLVKVSTMATSTADVRRLAELLLTTPGDAGLIVIGMGAVGTVSRIFFPALGSRLTYSFMGESRTSGQLDYTETRDLLRRFYPGVVDQKAAPHLGR